MIKQLSYISIVIYFIILSSLNTVNTKSITIFSENDFRKALNSDYSNIIFKSSISIEGNYTLNSSIDKINITGISKDVILKFKNDIDGLYINDCNIVNIYNLTLVGNLFISDSFNITISDVNINGLIQTSSSNVFLNKVTYNNNQSQKSQYGIIQNKGFLTIYNSYFYGSSSITENILYVTNDKKEEIENYENALLTIINSNFTGEYECGIIKASSYRLYIQYSNFERGFTYDNGAVLNSELSYVYIDDCFFEDNLSYNSGGVFYFDNNYYNHCYSSEFRNSTAYKDGGIVYISNLDVINSYFYNIIISNINQYTDSDSSGIIACLKGTGNLQISKLVFKNFLCNNNGSCSLFTLSNNSRVHLLNGIIENVIVDGEGGILFHLYDKSDNDIMQSLYASVINITMNNIVQRGPKLTSIFWLEGGYIRTNLFSLNNFDGYNSAIYYNSLKEPSEFISTQLYEIHIKSTDGIFHSKGGGIVIDSVNMINASFNGALFNNINSSYEILIYNSNFENICSFQKSSINSCLSKKIKYEIYKNSVFIQYRNNVIIENTKITSFIGDTGFNSEKDKYSLELKNVTIINNYYENSLLNININNLINGNLYISNSVIKNNTSGSSGCILQIKDIGNKSVPRISIYNTTFENNYTTKYGGVFFIKDDNKIDDKIIVENCTFKNNKALLGSICHSHSSKSEPRFSNKEDLIAIHGKSAFTTNPTTIKLCSESENIQNIKIDSGDLFNRNITFNLYDDYDNIINTGSDIKLLNIEDLIFFKLEMNDTYNTEIIGQKDSYCFGTTCEIPNFKIIGNPGNYTLKFIIYIFGQFSSFNNNEYHIPITIKNCDNSTYNYQHRDSNYIKSCYIPRCEPSCNSGICVNDNICNCDNTLKTGKTCNDFYKLKRVKTYDIIIRIISSILIINSIIVIMKIYIYKNDEVIKGGGKNFLILILIGTILNYIYIYLRTIKRQHLNCLFLDITKQIGFSLVFGSILVKTLRIYCALQNRIKKISLRTETMYFIIFLIMAFHITLIMIFELIHGHKTIVIQISQSKTYEYRECEKSNLTIISNILNFIIMAIGYYLTYSIRHIQNQYKESMTLTVYIYVIAESLLILIDSQNVSLVVKDYFNTIGPLLYSISTIFNIFYPKFRMMKERIKNENIILNDYEKKKEYEYQRRFDDFSRIF